MATGWMARLVGDHRRAAALYFSSGRIEQAAKMYEKAHEPLEAARLWLRSGREERALRVLEEVHPEQIAELLSEEDRDDLAIRYFEQSGAFWKAAECARRLRRPVRAARLFERAGALEQAATFYRDAGDDRELLRVWTKLSEELEAAGKQDDQKRIDLLRAKKLVELDDPKNAAGLLERHGRWLAAAKLWRSNNEIEKAIRAYLEGGNSIAAADLLEGLGDDLDSRLRARVLEQVSRHEEAAEAYEESGDISGAMRQLEAAGSFEQAAKKAEEKDDTDRAIELWLAAGRPDRGARLLATKGDYMQAAVLARQGGANSDAATYLSEMGDYLQAAQEHIKASEGPAAIRALSKVERGSSDHRAASRLLLPLLVKSGRFEEALSAAEALGPSEAWTELYWRGRALEGLSRRSDAIACFERISAEQPNFRDITERLRRLSGRSRGLAAANKAFEGFKPGERLQGRYEIEDEIGRGGWSRVYRARDVVRRLPVAIKLMEPRFSELGGAEVKLREEVRLSRRLRHPGIVRVFEFGKTDGRLFVVMELADGIVLSSRIEQGVLTEEQVGDLATDLVSALRAAHREGVVHRDLSPQNIMLTPDVAKIMDFGIALQSDGSFSVDSDGNVAGTPHYMSPEQIQGLPLDGRSDLYSLGSVLYFCLSGQPPFDGGTVTAISLKHLQDPPPALHRLRPEVSDSFLKIVNKLLEKNPESRYADADAVESALREWRDTRLL